ncbi:nucleoside-diphosphate-sugar epimerase [Hydrogenivirga caldilitoris]|uniref:Nucleoside-diphosphate-sugar epimerase n=1 Tax=Hydrogenivirga caldilitoris TaxID=246264 RepID=A0A497XMM6_9AQUI|nr:SDR family NAD(P)-dependent oxidoreductase [Hydrogenivirga caldilitoris]RLJ70088.1 nucleoside-diphosphate-sugar epimerase [Hydrogenivirga caldilitoris]
MKVLVTGSAGFIGWKVCEVLLDTGYEVVGVDNLNDYYDPSVKLWRLRQLENREGFKFYELDIEDYKALERLFSCERFDAVINEAARAGVRYSMENPHVYISTNVAGTLNLLELMKKQGIKKFVLASTSSLYAGQPMPFKEELPVNTPISPYAASKKAAEVLSYTYHYLYGIDVAVLRYFTVYGPAGRPDMSPFRFIYWVMKGEPIQLYGDGSQVRDFTYVDDIANGTVKALSVKGYEIINLGNNTPHKLTYMIELIERFTGRKAKINFGEFHKADMKETWADITKAKNILGWEPKTSLEEGIERTVRWFEDNWDWIESIRV